MDWTQTITIISSILAATYTFYRLTKEDIKKHDAELAEIRRKNEADLVETRKEFAEVRKKNDADLAETRKLWSSLLEKIYKIEQKIYALELERAHKNSK